jgi:hypothetical protein
MVPDLFELQDILASPLTTTIFVWATAAIMLANIALVLVLNRRKEKHPVVRILPRAI